VSLLSKLTGRVVKLNPDELYRQFLETHDEGVAAKCREQLLELAYDTISSVARKIMRAPLPDLSGRQLKEEGEMEVVCESCFQLARRMDVWRAIYRNSGERSANVTVPEANAGTDNEGTDTDQEPGVPADASQFRNYAASVTYSARSRWLRQHFRRYVAPTLEVRYLLTAFETLAVWADANGTLLAGYRVWKEKGISPAGERQMQLILDDPLKAARNGLARRGHKQSLEQTNPVAFLQALIDVAAGPIKFDDLLLAFEPFVLLIQSVPSSGTEVRGFGQGQEDGDSETLDVADGSIDDRSIGIEEQVSHRDFLRLLWAETHNLTYSQRMALLLNLSDGDVRQIVPMGIATFAEVALLLEMAGKDLVQIWQQLPLKDEVIGELLQRKMDKTAPVVTKEQVQSLRAGAQRRLQERLRLFVGGDLRALWLIVVVQEVPRPAIVMLHLRDRNGFSILKMLKGVSTAQVKLTEETLALGLKIEQATLKTIWNELPLRFDAISKIVRKPPLEVIILYIAAYDELSKSLPGKHRLSELFTAN
jgi:hypothetical protein